MESNKYFLEKSTKPYPINADKGWVYNDIILDSLQHSVVQDIVEGLRINPSEAIRWILNDYLMRNNMYPEEDNNL